MSMDALRNDVKHAIEGRIKGLTEALLLQGEASEATIRVRIGEIQGLRFALNELDETYRQLN